MVVNFSKDVIITVKGVNIFHEIRLTQYFFDVRNSQNKYDQHCVIM